MRKVFYLLAVGLMLSGCSDNEPDNPKSPDRIHCPNNEIIYKTKYGYPIELSISEGFGGTLQSNTYDDGYGHIVFDDDIKNIPAKAFKDIVTLKEVILPECVLSIEESAFSGCSELLSVNIGNNIQHLAYSAFYKCDKLQAFYGDKVSSDKRCVIIDNTLSAFAPSGLSEYTIPDGVTCIGKRIFFENPYLKSVALSHGVAEIEDSAFAVCSNLSEINIENNVRIIGNNAFYKCGKLEKIDLEGVEKIGNSAFEGCTMLDKIVLPESVKQIGGNAFYGITGTLIVYCDIPDGTSSGIGFPPDYNGAFGGSRFTDVIIGDNIASIGRYAFYNCRNLKNLTIGKNVKTIGDRAFGECSALTAIYCKPVNPPALGEQSFCGYSGVSGPPITVMFVFELPDLIATYVPMSAVETYESSKTVSWLHVQGYNYED